MRVFVAVLTVVASLNCFGQGWEEKRWDLTITDGRETYPSWIGVTEEQGTTVVRVVGRVGPVHIATGVRRERGKLLFRTKELFGREMYVDWEFNPDMTGIQTREDGVKGRIASEPAPRLDRPYPAKWTPYKALLEDNLRTWYPDDPKNNHWRLNEGVLSNEAAGSNLRTNDKFQDFRLHLEFVCPEGGNSGVFLRGRYEVQIAYTKGLDNRLQAMGGVYGFLAPSPARRIAPTPGQWESFDITLVGRHVNVVHNGVEVLDNKVIPGITGGAIDSHEADPGPLYLQGDDTGGFKFRNIKISVPEGR